MSGSFKNLGMWKKAHELVLVVHHATASFPKEGLYDLSSQMRRDAVSVPANIAEGYKRTGHLEKIRFFNIAQASLEEVSKMLESYIKRMKDNHVGEPNSEY